MPAYVGTPMVANGTPIAANKSLCARLRRPSTRSMAWRHEPWQRHVRYLIGEHWRPVATIGVQICAGVTPATKKKGPAVQGRQGLEPTPSRKSRRQEEPLFWLA